MMTERVSCGHNVFHNGKYVLTLGRDTWEKNVDKILKKLQKKFEVGVDWYLRAGGADKSFCILKAVVEDVEPLREYVRSNFKELCARFEITFDRPMEHSSPLSSVFMA